MEEKTQEKKPKVGNKKFVKRRRGPVEDDTLSKINDLDNLEFQEDILVEEAKPKKERKKISRRKPGSKPSLNYFDEITQQGIVNYQAETDGEKRKEIFVKEIMPAFDSLIENLINVYGFTVMYETKEDLKNECLEFLYSAVHKFDASKGSKAFSYFNVVAKNWLTIKSKQNMKKVQSYISIDNKDDFSPEDLSLFESSQVIPSYDELVMIEESKKDFIKVIQMVEERATTENEIACMKAIRVIVDNLEDIDLLSKRAVLCYLRELSALNGKALSVSLSNLKKYYREAKTNLNE